MIKYLFVIIFAFIACTPKKDYKILIKMRLNSVTYNKLVEEKKYSSDSDALLYTYVLFSVYKDNYNKFKGMDDTIYMEKPIRPILLNENGRNITDEVFFYNKEYYYKRLFIDSTHF